MARGRAPGAQPAAIGLDDEEFPGAPDARGIKRSVLSETIFGLGLGVLLGPPALDWLEVHDWGAFEKILQVATELTLSMALMATAFRIPKDYLGGNKRLQTVLVFVGMLGMCAVSSILVHLILGLDWRLSFLIGAIVTPTDPVVASTVVTGETAKQLIPARIRHAISFESGANDGLALPLVAMGVVILMEPQQLWTEWALKAVLWKTIGGAAFGFFVGHASSKLLIRARDAGWMSKTVLLSYSLSLGFFLLGFLEFVGSNGILGVFAGGLAANLTLNDEEDLEQEEIQESVERIFTIPIFVLFGMALPWSEWIAMGWKAPAIVGAILVLRRLPLILLLGPALRGLPSRTDRLFVGWFGPIGVAAIYYSVHSFSATGARTAWVVGSLVVFGSTVVHGLTGTPLAFLYHRLNGGESEAGQQT